MFLQLDGLLEDFFLGAEVNCGPNAFEVGLSKAECRLCKHDSSMLRFFLSVDLALVSFSVPCIILPLFTIRSPPDVHSTPMFWKHLNKIIIHSTRNM